MNTILPPERLVIASRESRLAMWQAKHIQQLLQGLYPLCEISILGMTTRGDQILDKSLSKIGGKGLFIKELEAALLDGRADLAIHSLKDVPMEMPEGFALSTILEREDPRDAFISNNYASLKEMPPGAIVGTSSLRREAQIRRKYPHLKIVPLRGNLDTRLSKLDSGEFDAMILACAGLLRLNLESRIRERIDPVDSLPAASQGALGIEILASNQAIDAYLEPLKDHLATLQVSAERQVSRRLGGSCEIPIAAYAKWEDDSTQLHLKALVASINGQEIVEATKTRSVATMEEAIQLGDEVADDLINKGAMELIAALGS